MTTGRGAVSRRAGAMQAAEGRITGTGLPTAEAVSAVAVMSTLCGPGPRGAGRLRGRECRARGLGPASVASDGSPGTADVLREGHGTAVERRGTS